VVSHQETYEKPHGGFLAIGPRYPSVLPDDGVVVLFTHPGDAQWTEVVDVEHRGSARRAAPATTVEMSLTP
jgi:hypothetical protein